MAQPIDADELRSAWRALEQQSAAVGWRTIPVLTGRACPILAGREYPGNEEAILVAFKGVRLPHPDSLPQGQGFLLKTPSLGSGDRNLIWIGLGRQPGAEPELFLTMATDVLATLESHYASDDVRRFSIFLSRIRTWQEFMRHGTPRVLSAEAEVGLFGELHLMTMLLRAGHPPTLTVSAWKGPQRGLHDFVLYRGAVEVKTALADRGFFAHIASLDQLDESLVNPLYLVATRLTLSFSGNTLSQMVEQVRALLTSHDTARAEFDDLVIAAGFVDSMSRSYVRAFEVDAVSSYAINDTFPRLTRSSVPRGVTRASYELDLGLASLAPVPYEEMLHELGVLI